MREITVVNHIKRICEERSWSCYRLAKESGIAYSTLSTMFHKTKAPSIHTLEKLCGAFGMTLAQFFDTAEEQTFDPRVADYLRRWEQLTPENRDAAEKYLDFLLYGQDGSEGGTTAAK